MAVFFCRWCLTTLLLQRRNTSIHGEVALPSLLVTCRSLKAEIVTWASSLERLGWEERTGHLNLYRTINLGTRFAVQCDDFIFVKGLFLPCSLFLHMYRKNGKAEGIVSL